jgi:hypothetical protein
MTFGACAIYVHVCWIVAIVILYRDDDAMQTIAAFRHVPRWRLALSVVAAVALAPVVIPIACIAWLREQL